MAAEDGLIAPAIKRITDESVAHQTLWAIAAAGVFVLVGLGKLKPETVEYLLFALLGRVAYVKPKLEGVS